MHHRCDRGNYYKTKGKNVAGETSHYPFECCGRTDTVFKFREAAAAERDNRGEDAMPKSDMSNVEINVGPARATTPTLSTTRAFWGGLTRLRLLAGRSTTGCMWPGTCGLVHDEMHYERGQSLELGQDHVQGRDAGKPGGGSSTTHTAFGLAVETDAITKRPRTCALGFAWRRVRLCASVSLTRLNCPSRTLLRASCLLR